MFWNGHTCQYQKKEKFSNFGMQSCNRVGSKCCNQQSNYQRNCTYKNTVKKVMEDSIIEYLFKVVEIEGLGQGKDTICQNLKLTFKGV